MRKSLRALNAKRRAANQFEISFGIGIATGQALVGEITGSDKTDYTAVGDVVNLAARVESQNKETGTDILLTDEVLRNVSDVAVVECCGDFKVKGKEIQVKLYKLIGIFDRDGIYQCHDEMWELGLIPPARAGLVFGAGKNLKTQDYKTKNAA
jgi:adenylate cyclase